MRLNLVLLMLVVSSQSFAQSCPNEKLMAEAKSVSESAISGKAVSLPPCLAAQTKKPVSRPVAKPIETKTSEVSQPQQMSTVFAPIVIVTGGASEAPQKQCREQRPQVIYRQSEPVVKIVRVHQPKKRNAVMIMGGIGPTGAHSDVDATNQTVHTNTIKSGVIGLQYQRNVSGDLLLGVTILSNTTATLNVGVEF